MKVELAASDEQQEYAGSVFPLIYLCRERTDLQAAVQWVEASRERLLQQTEQHGAVLLRDFPVQDALGFDAFILALGLENFPYKKSLSNAVRINRTERVFSANEAPSEVRIYFHHEMAQTPLFPRWIFFSCEVAPTSGGETPLCRSDELLERLEAECPAFVNACQQLGLKYTNVMPADDDAQSGMGRSWSSTLGVSTESEAESRLAELEYSWEWLENGALRATTPALPAVREVSNGRRAFFNQLIAAYCGWSDDRNDPSKAIRHGDGSPLDAAAVQRAAEIADELTFDMNWQVGDVVLIDNTLVMHARKPFEGARRVVASLAEMQTHRFEPNLVK